MKEFRNLKLDIRNTKLALKVGDAVFVVDAVKNKVIEYRVVQTYEDKFEAVSGIGVDILYHINCIGKLFFLSRAEASNYLKNNREEIIEKLRNCYEKHGEWAELAKMNNILAEEKENAPKGEEE